MYSFEISEEQQALRVEGKPGKTSSEALLDPGRKRQRLLKAEPARELRGRQSLRQLQNGERIPACLDDDSFQHLLVEARG